MTDPEDWQELLRRQKGLVTRAQALAHGLNDDIIEAHLDARRWQRVSHGVLSVDTGPLALELRHRAALLFARGPAALSHGAAAAVHGLTGAARPGDRVQLTVPYGSSARGCELVEVHRSRAFPHIVEEVGDLVVVSKVHTLLDLAQQAPDGRSAMRVLTSGAARARVAGERVVAAVELRRPRRYRTALTAAAKLLLEGVESSIEGDYVLDVEIAHGLPAATRQVPFLVGGHRLLEDNEYDMPAGTLVVRLDGWRHHANRRTAHRDRSRDNAAQLAGKARLVFGFEEVTREACATADIVGRVLADLGWEGRMTPCSRCA